MSENGNDSASPNAVQVDPKYVMQALETALTEARHQNLLLTALVNQQQEEIGNLKLSIPKESVSE